MEEASHFKPSFVLTVAFPYAAIGARAVGGAEVICTQLESALPPAEFGSAVVAHAASKPRGQLYGTRTLPGLITDQVRAAVEEAQQANIDRALADHPVSLVHMHGLDFARYRLPEDMPVVVTLHLPPSWYPATIWSMPPNYQFVCVSESQRRACPTYAQDRLVVIENGVEIPDEGSVKTVGRYAVMLARICPEKNLHVGLDAARLAGLPAVLAGEVYPYEDHLRYFDQEIEPRLTALGEAHEKRSDTSRHAPGARFVGPVSGAEKKRLLQRAACLLLPSLAPETSSLVAMEALAAGVPVVGMTVGAVPEIVDYGRTGFLVAPGEGAVERLATAMGRLEEIDRDMCRKIAAERFPVRRMIERYLGLYRRLIATTSRSERDLRKQRVDNEVLARASETSDLAVEKVSTTGELEALVPAWTDVWQRDPHATPFQHPAWLVPWWHQFGTDGELQALALRTGATGDLAGFVPLYLYRGGAAGKCTLLLVGAGTTDYLDGVWGGGNVPAIADCFLRHISGDQRLWDRTHLHQLRAGSPLSQAVFRASLPSFPTEACSSLDTRNDLPAKIRANTGRYRRRAGLRGSVACDYATSGQEALASFEALMEFHRQRWEGRGEAGVLSDERVVAHHRESLPWLLEAGLLRMFRLRISVETIGILYALADAPHAAERRLYLYLIGFDPRFADCSPGTLLVQEAWEHARANGFSKLDLLRGGESYKQLWGAQVEETLGIELRARSMGADGYTGSVESLRRSVSV